MTDTKVRHNGHGAVVPHQAPHRTRPGRSASAAEAVLAYAREQVTALRALEAAVRRDEPDSVHQMRVATRRLRSTLRSFDEVIPRSATKSLAAELQWFGRLLGAARDAEVLPEHLLRTAHTVPVELLIGPVQARLQGHYSPRRAAAHAEVIAALDSQRYATLLADLDRFLHEPPLGPQAAAPARKVLPAAVHRAYRQTKRRMKRAKHAPHDDVALHRARKSARRARYAAEAATPVHGKPARTFAKKMKKLQSVIGAHHDTILARAEARDLGIAAHLAGENAFTYGLLHERESRQSHTLRTQAQKTWHHSHPPKRLKK